MTKNQACLRGLIFMSVCNLVQQIQIKKKLDLVNLKLVS